MDITGAMSHPSRPGEGIVFRVALVGHGACTLARARSAHVLWPKPRMDMSLGATETRSTCPLAWAGDGRVPRTAPDPERQGPRPGPGMDMSVGVTIAPEDMSLWVGS